MLSLQTGVAGFFKLEAVRLDGTKRLLADWFPNLITDLGIDLLGSSEAWLTYCQVGTGSTAPAVTDTALASRLAAISATVSDTGACTSSSPYYTSRTRTYRFGVGVAAGNLTEVGISTSTTTVLFSRALILDSGGSPTTVTVLSDESLDVTYQVRQYIPEGDSTGTVVLRGTTHDWTGRASNVTTNSFAGWLIENTGSRANRTSSWRYAYSGAIGLITTYPSGTFSQGTASASSYTNGTFYNDFTLSFSITQGNFAGGIQSIAIMMGIGTYQFGFNPNIMKTSSDVLVLNFRHSWARKTI